MVRSITECIFFIDSCYKTIYYLSLEEYKLKEEFSQKRTVQKCDGY